MAFTEALAPVRFGEPPPDRASARLPNVDPLDAFRLDLLLIRALADAEAFRSDTPEERKERAERTWTVVFGEKVSKERKRSLTVSSASRCLREWGYGVLGYPPLERTPEEIYPLRAGSAEHRVFLEPLRPFGISEFPLFLPINEKLVLTGRADFYIYQLRDLEIFLDVKTTSREGFKMVRERGARPQDELQIQLYMKAWERAALSPMVGWDIYVCRDIPPGAEIREWMKKFATPFDAVAKYKVEQHLEKVVRADEALRRGELPEPSIDPGSADWACGKSCGFRDRCGPGQEFAAAEVKKQTKRVPAWAYKKAKAERESLEALMAANKITQLELPDLNLKSLDKPGKRRPTEEGLRRLEENCTEPTCGGRMKLFYPGGNKSRPKLVCNCCGATLGIKFGR